MDSHEKRKIYKKKGFLVAPGFYIIGKIWGLGSLRPPCIKLMFLLFFPSAFDVDLCCLLFLFSSNFSYYYPIYPLCSLHLFFSWYRLSGVDMVGVVFCAFFSSPFYGLFPLLSSSSM